MPDLDYVTLVGRFGIVVGDGIDVDDEPDVIWCDEGEIRLVPLNGEVKIASGSPVPWTGGVAVVDASIDTNGYLSWRGKQFVQLVDLTSDKVNPTIGSNKATHRVEFRNVKADSVPVSFTSATVRIAADTVDLLTGTCDLTKLLPVQTGNPTPIYSGPRGTGVTDLIQPTPSTMALELTDGTTTDPITLPVGPGGSDAGVAGYLADEDSDSRAILDPYLSAKMGTAATASDSPLRVGLDPVIRDKIVAAQQPAILAVAFGNSIANQCKDDDQATAAGTYDRYSPTDWARIFSEGRINFAPNKGIGGQRTSQFLARFDADILPSPAKIVLLPSPLTNDLFDGFGVTVAQMKANMIELYDRILASGRMVVETLTGPSGFGTTTTLGNLYEMQRWQRQYVLDKPGIILIDGHAPVADPADGWPLSGYCRPGDAAVGNNNRGVHPGYLWAARLGKIIAAALEPLYSRIPVLESPSNVDPRNALTNGRMAGNASGFATGYSVVKSADGSAAACTPTKVARSDGMPGEAQQIVVPSATWASEQPAFFAQDLIASGRWAVGDTVRMVVHFETDPDTAGAYPSPPSLSFWNGLGALSDLGFQTADRTATPAVPAGVDVLPRKGRLATPWGVVPTGTGRLQVRVPLPYGTTRIRSVQIQKAA